MASHITLGNLTVDRDRYEVWAGERRIALTFVEFQLLFHLARNPGRVVTRDRLLEAVWGEARQRDARKLTVHISRLRTKIRESRPWSIRTVRKRGYSLADAGSERCRSLSAGRSFAPSPSSQGLAEGG